MTDWQDLSVEDIASTEPNSLATGPFGSAIGAKFFVDAGVPVIRGSNLSANVGVRLVEDDFVFLNQEKATEFKRSTVRSGDLVFTCWGTINQIGLIDDRAKYPEYVISNKQMKLTCDTKKVDPHFIYYLFSSPEKQQEIINSGIGAAVPGFNLGQLKKMRLLLPGLGEQRAVVKVLKSLDDKIDLLTRQNKTLEAMAETLFRQWFGDEASEDWPEGTVEDLFVLQRGYDLPRQERIDGPYPIVTSSGFTGGHVEFKVKAPGVTTGRSGLLGQVYLVHENFWPLNTSLYVREFKRGTPMFSYLLLKTMDLLAFNAGSAVPTLNRNHVHAHKVPLPPADLIARFEELAEPLFRKVHENGVQSACLNKLRDTLLPKLMSGEVRVAC